MGFGSDARFWVGSERILPDGYREGCVTPDGAKGPQHHVLPIDDPLRMVNILREAAGPHPLSDEHDD